MINIAILDAEKLPDEIGKEHISFSNIFLELLEKGGLSLSPYLSPDSSPRDDQGIDSQVNVEVYDILDNPHNFPSLEPENDGIGAKPRPDVVMITGSTKNAYDNDPWILNLIEFIQQCFDVHPTKKVSNLVKPIKIIGICFGHQVIGRALGARVGPNPKGWELSITPIQLTETGASIFPEFKDTGCFNLMEFHQDIVFEVPKGLDGIEVTGKSDVCDIQGFYKKGYMWSLQGHPELNEALQTKFLTVFQKSIGLSEKQLEEKIDKAGLRNDGNILAKSMVRFIKE